MKKYREKIKTLSLLLEPLNYINVLVYNVAFVNFLQIKSYLLTHCFTC